MDDIYILDDRLRRIEVFDYYKSFIWTERFSSIGDFELVIQVEPRVTQFFVIDNMISIRDSLRVMVIETIEEKSNDEGRFLTISGRSLEKVLEDRVAKQSLSGTEADPVWKFVAKPADIVRYIFSKICVEGILSPADKIPFIQPGALFPNGTLPEPQEQISIEIPPGDLYSIFKQILDPYNLGFRIIRNFDFSELYFEVYTGNNLTTGQTSNDPVVFSPALDNLTDTTELNSSAVYKNVAYVFSKYGQETVYVGDSDPSTSGFDRRVLVVNASEVDLPLGPELTNVLNRKGLEALSDHRSLFAFDGEVPQTNSQYSYGNDYQMGDLVETQNNRGASNWMRVTEQIFVSDAEGRRSYPTLVKDSVIMPGAWDSWDYNGTWDTAEGTWEEQR